MSSPQASPSLESQARLIGDGLTQRKIPILIFLTAFYLLGAILHARSKPFWYDEIITLISANTPDAATAWKAALSTDANPPLPHLLTHFAVRWLGVSEVTARIPAIAGFWVFCLCLFQFTLRRLGIFYALSALLLPTIMETYAYAFEARAYGPELAFCGIALLAWQSAAERSRLWLAIPSLALGLAGAVFCHYYAVLIYVPLAGAELIRSLREREVNWGTWVAFLAGGAPIAWRMATIVGVVQGAGHTWAPPHPEQVIEFWDTGLHHTLSFFVLLLALLAVSILLNHRREEGSSAPSLPLHELFAGILFLAIPVIAVAGALSVTHMFTTRYALIALTGFVFLFPMVSAYLVQGRSLPGFLMFLVLTAGLGFQAIDVPGASQPYQSETLLHDALQQGGPVVIPDGQLFLQMWHYAPPPLKKQLVYLADNESAVKYMGFDTIDGGLRELTRWSSVQVQEYRDFARPGREFTVYHTTLRPGWLLPRISADGGAIAVRKLNTYRAVLNVRIGP